MEYTKVGDVVRCPRPLETEEQEDCCETCRFWQEYADRATALKTSPGRCRLFPKTKENKGRCQWCGQHSATRPKPVDAEHSAMRPVPIEDLPLAEIHEDPADALPLSADGVRIAPGMVVHHPRVGAFAANAWVRTVSQSWLIQKSTDRLKSDPVSVGECYWSHDAMPEAANGSS